MGFPHFWHLTGSVVLIFSLKGWVMPLIILVPDNITHPSVYNVH